MQCITAEDLLKFATENGMINPAFIHDQIEMERKEELLKKHPYSISCGKDGKWRTYLPDENGRRMIKKSTREAVEAAVIEYWKSELENPTIAEVFTEYNDRRLELKKISPATHLRNRQVFNRHYVRYGKKRIKAVSAEDIESFLEEQISEHNLTAKAFANLKTITRGLLKRAKRRKLIDYNVEEIFQEMDTSETDFRKVIKEDCEEVYDEDELPRVFDYLKKNPTSQNLGILLMFLTGIRVGELVALKHSVFEGNVFKIRRTETRYLSPSGKYIYEIKDFPKTEAGVRTAIIPKDYMWLADSLKRMNPFGEFIFVNKDGKRLTSNCIRRQMRKMCACLGIVNKSPHKARKTYGSILLDNSIDRRLITDVMGHTDISCTEGHYHRNRRSIDRKIEILSSIPEFATK